MLRLINFHLRIKKHKHLIRPLYIDLDSPTPNLPSLSVKCYSADIHPCSTRTYATATKFIGKRWSEDDDVEIAPSGMQLISKIPLAPIFRITLRAMDLRTPICNHSLAQFIKYYFPTIIRGLASKRYITSLFSILIGAVK